MKAKKNWSMELVGVCISGGGAVIHDIHRNPACNYSDSRIAPPTLRSTVTLTLHFAEGHQGGKSVCPAPRADLPPPFLSSFMLLHRLEPRRLNPDRRSFRKEFLALQLRDFREDVRSKMCQGLLYRSLSSAALCRAGYRSPAG